MSRAKSKREKQNKRLEEHNLRNQQEAVVRKHVYQTSFRDRVIKEIVCTQTPTALDSYLKSTLTIETPQVYFPLNETYQDGLVLVNQLMYEFTVNRPSISRVSDLEDLHSIDMYQNKEVVYNQPVVFVNKNLTITR
jgi:hypothetical protein